MKKNPPPLKTKKAWETPSNFLQMLQFTRQTSIAQPRKVALEEFNRGNSENRLVVFLNFSNSSSFLFEIENKWLYNPKSKLLCRPVTNTVFKPVLLEAKFQMLLELL